MIGSNSPFLMYCTWQIKSDLIHLPSPQSVSFLLHQLLSFPFHLSPLLLSTSSSLFFPSNRLQVCFSSRMQSSARSCKRGNALRARSELLTTPNKYTENDLHGQKMKITRITSHLSSSKSQSYNGTSLNNCKQTASNI